MEKTLVELAHEFVAKYEASQAALAQRIELLDKMRTDQHERMAELDAREKKVENREKAAGQIYKVAADRLGVIKGLEKSLADEVTARKAADKRARDTQAELDQYNEVFGKVVQAHAKASKPAEEAVAVS